METTAAALGPLDLVKCSALKDSAKKPCLDTKALAILLEDIAQTAAGYINSDLQEEFLYKNPNGWKRRPSLPHEDLGDKTPIVKHYRQLDDDDDDQSLQPESAAFARASISTSSEESLTPREPWQLVGDFDFHAVVRQITEFVETWKLTPATKFVVIAQEQWDTIDPLGERYYVEAHFSKPTPKCPNPLAVAKVYFHINVCHLLPRDYPVNVTYKFEGYRSRFYAVGEKKMSSNAFQRFMIDTVLHMKLAFYAELCECRRERSIEEEEERKGQATGR